MTHQMGDEYLIGLCGYIEMMKKRYKKNSVKVKVSRLFTCMRKTMNNNMIITLTFIFTALSILAVLLGDLLMTLVDPRIQLTAKGED